MHYPNFGEMAARLACKFNAVGIPAITAMAKKIQQLVTIISKYRL